MLKKANIQWTGKTLCNQIEKGQVLFDCAIQRNPVWDVSRKSLLIHSMIEGYPIPAFYFSRRDDGKYDALDGLQRSTAISEFYKEEYVLSDDTPSIKDEENNFIDVAGMKFSELPEWARDNILSYSLTIYYFEDITDEEISELFFRINNGKPLTNTELTRVKAKCLKEFQQIARHNLISSSISDAGKKHYNDENTAMQAWLLCFTDVRDFSTKVFRPCIEKADVTDEQMSKINEAMDYVEFICDSLDTGDKDQKRVFRKIRTRTNLVSSIYIAMRAIRNGVSKEDFKIVLYRFFNTSSTSIDDNYNKSIGSGSAKPEKVRMRVAALDALIKNTEPSENNIEQDIEESNDMI